jgi:hypothetical protein
MEWARRRPGEVAAAATCSGEGRLGGEEERAGELWVGRRRVEEGATWLAVGPQPELAAARRKDASGSSGADGAVWFAGERESGAFIGAGRTPLATI